MAFFMSISFRPTPYEPKPSAIYVIQQVTSHDSSITITTSERCCAISMNHGLCIQNSTIQPLC